MRTRHSRCRHEWVATRKAPSLLTHKTISVEEQCIRCLRYQHRVWGAYTSPPTSWWRAGRLPYEHWLTGVLVYSRGDLLAGSPRDRGEVYKRIDEQKGGG